MVVSFIVYKQEYNRKEILEGGIRYYKVSWIMLYS